MPRRLHHGRRGPLGRGGQAAQADDGRQHHEAQHDQHQLQRPQARGARVGRRSQRRRRVGHLGRRLRLRDRLWRDGRGHERRTRHPRHRLLGLLRLHFGDRRLHRRTDRLKHLCSRHLRGLGLLRLHLGDRRLHRRTDRLKHLCSRHLRGLVRRHLLCHFGLRPLCSLHHARLHLGHPFHRRCLRLRECICGCLGLCFHLRLDSGLLRLSTRLRLRLRLRLLLRRCFGLLLRLEACILLHLSRNRHSGHLIQRLCLHPGLLRLCLRLGCLLCLNLGLLLHLSRGLLHCCLRLRLLGQGQLRCLLPRLLCLRLRLYPRLLCVGKRPQGSASFGSPSVRLYFGRCLGHGPRLGQNLAQQHVPRRRILLHRGLGVHAAKEAFERVGARAARLLIEDRECAALNHARVHGRRGPRARRGPRHGGPPWQSNSRVLATSTGPPRRHTTYTTRLRRLRQS